MTASTYMPHAPARLTLAARNSAAATPAPAAQLVSVLMEVFGEQARTTLNEPAEKTSAEQSDRTQPMNSKSTQDSIAATAKDLQAAAQLVDLGARALQGVGEIVSTGLSRDDAHSISTATRGDVSAVFLYFAATLREPVSRLSEFADDAELIATIQTHRDSRRRCT